ncbi:MAG: peptidase domain-containing ABC transporter [Bacteroidota bacterium]|nr:peptidase domain-containing ABC transporter [Bacteroidota bacterium]
MKIFSFYKQLITMDCGPTCIKMVAKYYGKAVNIETIRINSQISQEGVSLLGIAEAAEKIGFNAKGVSLTYNELVNEAKLPAILHWEQNHFVVAHPKSFPKAGFFNRLFSKGNIEIADPGKGMITYTKEEFLRHWISTKDENTGEPLGVALLLEPTPAFFNQEEGEVSDKKNKGLGWGILLGYLKQNKKYIYHVFLAMGIASLLQLIFPFLTQSIVDTGINTNNLPFIYLVLIAQFMLFFSRTIVEFIRSRLLLYISTHINASILSDFWIKLMRLPMSFFDTKMTGDIIQRLGDHKRIESFLTGSTLSVLFSLVNLVLFSVVLLLYNKTIFFIFAIGSILYFFWIKLFLKFRRQLDYKRFAIASKENTATMQLIYGMQEIKLNGAEQLKRWEWENLQARLFKLSFKGLSLSQYQQAGVFFINEGKNILITFFVAKAVLDGQLTLGAMLAIQSIIGQLNSPVEQLISFTQSAQDAKISLERLNEIHQLEEEEAPSNSPAGGGLNTLPSDRAICFNDVSYTYPGAGNDPVLKNISCLIPEGKLTAIVGMSGSGKTTMLKLLLEFYENFNGEISLTPNPSPQSGEGSNSPKTKGTSLKYISPRLWRRQCGSVMQDGYIFNDNIAKNIAVSDEVPDYNKLVHACRVANILSFIESMPLGFNTKIGAEGNGISAGQKQRILIARAVYKDPEYLFFDEATNSLDANNERTIMENLQEFFKEKTVIIVAHRLSTVQHADNIIVLHNGMITEQGTHNELTQRRGEYYELVKNQLELGN